MGTRPPPDPQTRAHWEQHFCGLHAGADDNTAARWVLWGVQLCCRSFLVVFLTVFNVHVRVGDVLSI